MPQRMPAMTTLLIAIGNSLRRDDGAAHRAVAWMSLPAGVRLRSVHQLTPELAQEISGFDEVIFVDAATVGGPGSSLEELEGSGARPALGHAGSPAQVVDLARRLYGFQGRALVCSIPGTDFGAGEGLSPTAANAAADAARLLVDHLERARAGGRP